MAKNISAQELQRTLWQENGYALLDIRERNEYESGQIFGATQIPRRELEVRIQELVPVKSTPLVLYDWDGERASLAAATLEAQHYTQVRILEGGLQAWQRQGLPIVRGVHVLSKAFGEIVGEYWRVVPKLTPRELKRWMDSRRDDFVVIEVRPYEEASKTGSIPGAVVVSGVELPLRVADYVQAGKKIVTTCAGRTRGYIACATLKKMNIARVYDLDNGTKGWKLAGFSLQKEVTEGPLPSAASRAAAEQFAKRLAREEGIASVSAAQLRAWQQEAAAKTLYVVDVRRKEEYETEGHIPGARWVAGGQAIQNADDTVVVPGARIVFVCDDGTRSVITAYWYQQMGFDQVYVLEKGMQSWQEEGRALEFGQQEKTPLGYAEAVKQVDTVSVASLRKLQRQEAATVVLDVSDSRSFAAGHIPGARWLSRSWLEKRITTILDGIDVPVVVTAADAYSPVLAAADLQKIGYRRVTALAGGTPAWRKAGKELVVGLDGIVPDDWHIHLTEYDLKQSAQYLAWEEDLAYLPAYMEYFRRKRVLEDIKEDIAKTS
ncbi:rhodanese-like domain-containing protein [Anaeroarcus burkinensis]|uniref:rhodanese-like domain-containing protein n=1 Tax=Anaeroarcus burkinensis TaxID=82376 RepID=UPI0004084510|nr:rhodanese-like domain-containing protein [Anaeroarcus burkinensis]